MKTRDKPPRRRGVLQFDESFGDLLPGSREQPGIWRSGLIGKLHHYAHALEWRFFQLYELSLMRREGIAFDRRFYFQVWTAPGSTEDWVNLARFLRPDEKVFLIDIGANVGDFTAKFLSLYKDSRSVCFEPVRATFDQLASRFSWDRRVATYPFALSDADGEAAIYIQEDNTLCSLIQYMAEANAFYQTATRRSEQIACARLDSFAFKKDGGKLLIKIDVQGLEVEVIRGGMDTIAQADVLLLECSFAKEYADREPSFSSSCTMLRECGLFPIVFQDFGRTLSNYAFERDVIFVKRALLDNIWFRSSSTSLDKPRAVDVGASFGDELNRSGQRGA